MRNADPPSLNTLALFGNLSALSGVGCSIVFFVGVYASPTQAQIVSPLSSNDISWLFPLTEESGFRSPMALFNPICGDPVCSPGGDSSLIAMLRVKRAAFVRTPPWWSLQSHDVSGTGI